MSEGGGARDLQDVLHSRYFAGIVAMAKLASRESNNNGH